MIYSCYSWGWWGRGGVAECGDGGEDGFNFEDARARLGGGGGNDGAVVRVVLALCFWVEVK